MSLTMCHGDLLGGNGMRKKPFGNDDTEIIKY